MMKFLATVPQVLKLAGMFTEVPRDRMNGIGFGLAAIVAEYLCQPKPQQLSLKIVRQVLGLPSLAEDVWITVDWQETSPKVTTGFAVMSGPAKQHRTVLARLRPTDFGFLNTELPYQVTDTALAWGYKSVPRTALETLLRNPPPVRGRYPGDAMVLLNDGHYAYLRFGHDGSIRAIDQMDVTALNFSTNWSFILAQ